MKKTAALTLLLFTFFTAGAQHKKIDTLRLALIKARTDTARYIALHDLGNLYYSTYPDSAVYFDQQSFLLAQKNNWEKSEGGALNNLASDYELLGDFPNTIQYYLKSLRIDERIHDAFGILNVNSNIGAAYIAQADYKRALPYLLLAQKQLWEYTRTRQIEQKYRSITPINLSNIGEDYLNLQKLDSAKYYLDAAYKSSVAVKYSDVDGSIERDLGEVERLKGNNKGALQYFREALISDKAADNEENLSVANLSIAEFYYKNKQHDSAFYYAQKALEVATKGNFKPDVLNAAKELYTYYNELNNLPLAFKYFKLSTTIKDSLFSQDKAKQLLTLDFNEKERQQELQAEQARAQNRLRIYILSGGLGILLLLALIFWRNSNQRKKANRLLSKQKEIIEEQRDQTHKALTELQQTQTQLIQREKMASLGELTAGIAHEIQNPLNFVNNFSEVNKELIDEMQQEIEKGHYKDVKAISDDIKENEEKISYHGKRADFIVKGMLQHSRSGTGERQLTNINVLAEEFFKLSYQGLRAKDKNFNAEMVTHLDPNLPKPNVVQQDIGRILLNLFNNAFYAVNQKAKTAAEDYTPEVTLTTSAENGSLLIKVKDNGVGIPEAIKEKILQPFFTTKPTGEGTGLGLSLSYDILVKGHNGILDIDSKEGEGAEFIVRLPLS